MMNNSAYTGKLRKRKALQMKNSKNSQKKTHQGCRVRWKVIHKNIYLDSVIIQALLRSRSRINAAWKSRFQGDPRNFWRAKREPSSQKGWIRGPKRGFGGWHQESHGRIRRRRPWMVMCCFGLGKSRWMSSEGDRERHGSHFLGMETENRCCRGCRRSVAASWWGLWCSPVAAGVPRGYFVCLFPFSISIHLIIIFFFLVFIYLIQFFLSPFVFHFSFMDLIIFLFSFSILFKI